jgi:ribosome-associated translation inhibitor RaiA
MQIQVDTDHNIEASEKLVARVEAEIRERLARFAEHLTRVEVHLSDESDGRSTGEDTRCVLQARPAGRSSLTVTHDAATLDEALHGAVHRLKRLLASDTASSEDKNGKASIRGPRH